MMRQTYVLTRLRVETGIDENGKGFVKVYYGDSDRVVFGEENITFSCNDKEHDKERINRWHDTVVVGLMNE